MCLIFNFKVFELPPLHMQNAYSKYFGHNYFISERFSEFMRYILRLLDCKNMTLSYVCGVSEM